jgi:hypothetical protein
MVPVRVYLVGYIFYIIDCHICRDIFGRIDIMYCRLPYVSRGALLLKTLKYSIYTGRETQTIHPIITRNLTLYGTPILPTVFTSVPEAPMLLSLLVVLYYEFHTILASRNVAGSDY